MASHLPIVATPVGGIPQLVKNDENGYLVPCGDHEALAEAVEKIFLDPKKWARFSMRSREIVEKKFSMYRVEKYLSALYRSLLE
jgi:glycosyltransferase involved in cell wall biosynthesis